MSGIAGILRRDSRPIPERWITLLETTLSGESWRYEDSAEIASGRLDLLLFSSSGLVEEESGFVRVVDGEYAEAVWDRSLLELTLIRRGSGQKQLYMLDLDEAGDGVVFCSNPMPLIKIANELELKNDDVLSATQQFLQLGFVTGEHTLLSPVQSVPLHFEKVVTKYERLLVEYERSSSASEDVISLVAQIGQPFADFTLLSRLWLYKSARRVSDTIYEGLPDSTNRVKQIQKLSRWQGMLSQLPKQSYAKDWTKFGITSADTIFNSEMIERLTGQRYETPFCPEYSGSIEEQLFSYDQEIRNPDAVLRGMAAAATIARVELQIGICNSNELKPYPLASWLRSPQSSLGQLIGDSLNSENAFDNLPVDREIVVKLYESHLTESADYTTELFALLTLDQWAQQARHLALA